MVAALMSVLLLHVGLDHGWLHIWILVVGGVVANLFFYGGSGVNRMARRSLERAITTTCGGRAEIEGLDLPIRRGALTFERLTFVESDAAGVVRSIQVERGEAAVTLGALVSEEVDVPTLHLGEVVVQLARREDDAAPRPDPHAARTEASDPADDGTGDRRYRVHGLTVGRITMHGDPFPPEEAGGESGAPHEEGPPQHGDGVALDGLDLGEIGGETGVRLPALVDEVVRRILRAARHELGDEVQR